MNGKNRMILDEYKKQRPYFVQLGDVVHEKLQKIVEELHVEPMGIEHRVKKEDSLAGKLLKKGDSYRSLEDITDILGARVICFFADEVDKVGELVVREFQIDEENSVDKREVLDAETFGYLSLHYICSLKDEEDCPEEWKHKRFEIQIRSGLQHIWAAIDHDIAYKSKFGVPRKITREFSRLAGLFELADDEFVRARDNMNHYIQDTQEKIMADEADDLVINPITLKEYMLCNRKMRAFLDSLAAIENSEIRDTDPNNYIEQLNRLHMNTLGDLEQMLSDNKDFAYKLAVNALKGSEMDILSSNVALRVLCRAVLMQQGATFEQAVDFLKMSVGDSTRAENQAKKLFKLYEQWKETKE